MNDFIMQSSNPRSLRVFDGEDGDILDTLQTVLTQIAAYEAGKVDLDGLISNLEALRYQLQDVSESWIERFWSEWGTLEIMYSVAIDREQPVESPANRADIDSAVRTIKEMIIELLTRTN